MPELLAGRPSWGLAGWGEGFLSLFPHLIKQSLRLVCRGCGCGWVEHNVAAGSDCRARVSVYGLGALLGPEETPVWVFLV